MEPPLPKSPSWASEGAALSSRSWHFSTEHLVPLEAYPSSLSKYTPSKSSRRTLGSVPARINTSAASVLGPHSAAFAFNDTFNSVVCSVAGSDPTALSHREGKALACDATMKETNHVRNTK